MEILPWPSQSPDMNPIEHLWQRLKARVSARKPTNLNNLEKIVREEWAKLNDDGYCARLVETYQNRIDALIEAKGYNTKY